ncbi:MAG: outer membrane beta-barrel protein [Planctomycetota bacterium]|nr:outer membrane beta-barrel protein [Planctomycetota bacterium]
MNGNRKKTRKTWLEFERATGWLRLPAILLALATAAFSPVSGRADESWDSFLSRYGAGKNDRQFYLAGIVGADFATLDKVTGMETTVPNQSIFTAGGAAGIRFLRENGGLRLEFEGRGRDQVLSTVADPDIGSFTTQATDGWSAMVNVWRDYKPFDSFGLYGGGGIGGGGYRSVISGTELAPQYATANDRVTNFAWQAGGGIFYEISQRATLDLGYRFFSISESTATGESIIGGGPFTYPTNFAASELLLTLRIYEPFRGWRKR